MDIWRDTNFEFYAGKEDRGYINFELLSTGELEIVLCDGALREDYRDGRRETRQDEIKLSVDRTEEFLLGLQVWIEGLT